MHGIVVVRDYLINFTIYNNKISNYDFKLKNNDNISTSTIILQNKCYKITIASVNFTDYFFLLTFINKFI